MKTNTFFIAVLAFFNAFACTSENSKQNTPPLEDTIVYVSPLVDLNSYDPHKIRVYVPPYTNKGAVKAEEAVSVTLKTAEKTFQAALAKTGEMAGEYKLDLDGELNSKTPVDVTFEAMGEFRIGLSKEDFVLKRTVHLNQSEDVEIAMLEVYTKDGLTNARATFNEELKGALEAFIRFNLKTGVIELKARIPTAVVNGEPVAYYNPDEYASDIANYVCESDIALSDVVSVEVVGEVFSIIKNKTTTVKRVAISDGKWYRYETGAGNYMYKWFAN